MQIRQGAPYLLIFCAYAAIFVPVLLTQRQVFLPSAGDQPVGFFPVGSGSSAFSAWSTQNLGTPIQHSFGLAFFLVIQLLTGSAFAAQLTIYFGLFVIGSFGIVYAFRQLKLIKNDLLLVPIALAYSLNWNLFATMQLLQIAFTASAPFVFLYAVKLLIGMGRTGWNILGLTGGLLIATLFANVGGFGNAIYVLIPVFFGAVLTIRNRQSFLRLFKGVAAVGLAIVLATLVALPFFYGGYLLLLTGGFHHYVEVSSGGSLTDVTPLTRLFYLPTLMPYAISPFLVGSSPTLTDSFWPLSMSAIVLAGVALLGKNGLRKSLALGFMLTLLVLLLLIHLIVIQAPIVDSLYAAIPLLFVLIEGQNYLYTITPLWFILVALGMSALEQRSMNSTPFGRKAIKVGAVFLAVLTLTSSVSAFAFQPLEFSTLYQRPVNPGFPAQPPQSIVDLFISIQQNRTVEGPFRVLWLPYPLWLAQMFYSAGTPDVLNLHSLGNQAVLDAVYAGLAPILNSTTTNFGESIAPFGFKYIVVPTYFTDTEPISFQSIGSSPIQIDGNPRLFVDFLSSQTDVKLVKEDATYMLYLNTAIPKDSSGVFWVSNSKSSIPSVAHPMNQDPPGVASVKSMAPSYSPSNYVVSVNVSKPAWIVFDQTFDSGWTAHVSGQSQRLNHSAALGWANAFFIPTPGNFLVNVDYEPQAQYIYAWVIAAFVALSLITICVRSIYLERLRKAPLIARPGLD